MGVTATGDWGRVVCLLCYEVDAWEGFLNLFEGNNMGDLVGIRLVSRHSWAFLGDCRRVSICCVRRWRRGRGVSVVLLRAIPGGGAW